MGIVLVVIVVATFCAFGTAMLVGSLTGSLPLQLVTAFVAGAAYSWLLMEWWVL